MNQKVVGPIGEKGRKYLDALYDLAGVGKGVRKRLRFMEYHLSDGSGGKVRVSHARTPTETLDLLEISAVSDIRND
jgi:hypothetical protein